jgi:hypothetical protein
MWKPLIAALIAATLLVPTQASALENEDLLALVAMPLAVAAVSEITDVPVSGLIDVVTLLNDAAVPPAQFIETVRYIPVALVTGDDDFVEYVRLREQEGVRGTALVTSIAERLQIYGLPDADLAVTRLRTIDVVEDDFLPRPVRLRLAEAKQHPRHPLGAPPGQLKKAAGARVVTEVVEDKQERKEEQRERKIRPREVESHTRAVAEGHGHGKSHGNGNGHGKGKGKG